MTLAQKIEASLRNCEGQTARDLAKLHQVDRSEVNSCLYELKLGGIARQGTEYRWYLNNGVSKQTVAIRPTAVAIATDIAPAAPAETPQKVKAPYTPTPEQVPVIEAAPDARLFVEAGPGTGKTETLVARLIRLLSRGLNPSQILVLSFSVAAVRELKARIARQSAGHSALAFVDIRTFDSYASRFLRQLIPASELRDLNYDERILRASREIKKDQLAARLLASLKHLFLDEMQDLVGVRADFALALLQAIKPRFTLFGDSAQGIYDFTIDGGPSKTTSADLLKSIRNVFPDLDDRHRFTINHRAAGSARLEGIASHGRTLLLESADQARVYLEKEFGSLPAQGTTQNPEIHSSLQNGSTCVVCRTNGQVFRLAGQLLEKGIPFQLARDRNEFLPPAWLGREFLGWQEALIRKVTFMEKARTILGVDESAAQTLWNGLLAACAQPKAVTISLTELRAAISDGIPFPEHPLHPPKHDAIHLSTIHRSKGQEFGNVIVVMNSHDTSFTRKGEDKKDDASEPRVLFVALTRARDSLHRMEARTKGIWRPEERWVRTFPNDKGFIRLFSIQVGHSRDIDYNSFSRGDAEEVRQSQKWLAEHAAPGTPIELWLSGSVGQYPVYNVMLAGTQVGNMSEHFGKSLFYTLTNLNNLQPKRFPKRITGLWVKEIITAVGDLACDAVHDSFRTSGLWMSLALEGLGNCEWY